MSRVKRCGEKQISEQCLCAKLYFKYFRSYFKTYYLIIISIDCEVDGIKKYFPNKLFKI